MSSEPQAVSNSQAQIRSIIERVESIETSMKEMSEDRGDIYKEAKGNGFDVKALRTIVRLRKMDANDRAEQDAILDTYMHALGMV
jgi:uncharacterized protein (UPF0335 family)